MRQCTSLGAVRVGGARAAIAPPPPPRLLPHHHFPRTHHTRRAPHSAEGEEEGEVEPLSYAINADRYGPVGHSSVGIVEAVRGVKYLLYGHDATHSNFLKTLEALRDKVDRRLRRSA